MKRPNYYGIITAKIVGPVRLPNGVYTGTRYAYRCTISGTEYETDIGIRTRAPGVPVKINVINQVGYLIP